MRWVNSSRDAWRFSMKQNAVIMTIIFSLLSIIIEGTNHFEPDHRNYKKISTKILPLQIFLIPDKETTNQLWNNIMWFSSFFSTRNKENNLRFYKSCIMNIIGQTIVRDKCTSIVTPLDKDDLDIPLTIKMMIKASWSTRKTGIHLSSWWIVHLRFH